MKNPCLILRKPLLWGLFLLTVLPFSPAHSPAQAAQEEPAPQPTSTPTAKEKVFEAHNFVLDNGLQIVVIPNNRAPVVTHMLWYKVGAAAEPRGKSGIAHFLEHLMFKGSSQMGGSVLAPGAFSKKIRALGGQDNAFTSQDYTAYFQSVPANHLETVMRMEAGRMRGLAPPPAEIISERKVIVEERKQRTDNNPEARFSEQLSAHAYINHPYGTPVIGWEDEIKGLDWTMAKHFYDRWYAPNNAILVISGAVTPADVFAKAIDIYGPIARRTLAKRLYPQTPPMASRSRLTLRDAAIHEPSTYTLYRVPSSRQNKEEALALTVLAEIMGGGPTSRLYHALVTQQKIASSAGLSYDPARWSDAELSIYAVPKSGSTIAEVQKALRAELRKIVHKGVKPKELSAAITRLADASIYARDSLSGPAMIIGRALATGSSLNDVEYWPHDLAAVTIEQVHLAAQTYLDPDNIGLYPPVTGVLMPEVHKKKTTTTGDVQQ